MALLGTPEDPKGSNRATLPLNYHDDQRGAVTLRVQECRANLDGDHSSPAGLKMCSVRGKSSLVLETQPVLELVKFVDLGGEPTTVILLNQHNS